MIQVHHSDQSETGTIYISDQKGIEFVRSLEHNVRSAYSECEFDKVQALEGIYLANVKETLTGISSGDPLLPSRGETTYAQEAAEAAYI
jgi:hypothetical protein